MRLQKIQEFRVQNYLPFGRDLQAVTHDMSQMVAEIMECGFQDGGCLVFASALRDWSNGTLELVAAYHPERGEQAQHVLAMLRLEEQAFYLDSDGIGTADDILIKLEKLEHLNGGYISAYDVHKEVVIQPNKDLSEAIANALEQRFGAFHQNLLLKGATDMVDIQKDPSGLSGSNLSLK